MTRRVIINSGKTKNIQFPAGIKDPPPKLTDLSFKFGQYDHPASIPANPVEEKKTPKEIAKIL